MLLSALTTSLYTADLEPLVSFVHGHPNALVKRKDLTGS